MQASFFDLIVYLVSSCRCRWSSGSSSLTLTRRSDLSDLGNVSYMFSRILLGSLPASELNTKETLITFCCFQRLTNIHNLKYLIFTYM
jgi:hypothetical protein